MQELQHITNHFDAKTEALYRLVRGLYILAATSNPGLIGHSLRSLLEGSEKATCPHLPPEWSDMMSDLTHRAMEDYAGRLLAEVETLEKIAKGD